MGVYGARALAMLAAFLFAGLLLAARLGSAPSGDGYRHALAAGPAGTAYAVEGDRALSLGPYGGVRRVGTTRGDSPLALSADGDRLLLGTDRGLQASEDGGRAWRRVGPPGHYPAVLREGDLLLAGDWSRGLEVSADAGRTWQRRRLPASNEVLALADARGAWYAATLTGLVASPDRGLNWEPVPGTERASALEAAGGVVTVGTWRGRVARVGDAGAGPPRQVGGGVWALSGQLVATTAGLAGTADPRLARAEVTALVASGPARYAGVARGPLYRSLDAGATWQRIEVGGQP